MSRAILQKTIIDRHGNVLPNITVYVYESGTTTPIASPMYTTLTGGTTLSNPLTTDINGGILVYLNSTQPVDLYVVQGSHTRTVSAMAVSVEAMPDATDIVFAPSVPTNWTTSPTKVNTALDEVGARRFSIMRYDHIAFQESVGSTETSLASVTLDANALTEGMVFRINAWAEAENNANVKTLRLYFGAAQMIAFQPPINKATKNAFWMTSYKADSHYENHGWKYIQVADEDLSGLVIASYILDGQQTFEDETAPILIKLTGQGVADGDLEGYHMLVELLHT